MEGKKPLRKGYTTGLHASFAFQSALEFFLKQPRMIQVITYKMDNDDLDVTKGCEIIVTLSHEKEDLPLNPIKHEPYVLKNLKLYAGVGVGVVTKEGLRPPKGYPAINPTPLKAIKEIYDFYYEKGLRPHYGSFLLHELKAPKVALRTYEENEETKKSHSLEAIFCSISVSNGENIAKETANAKVGVLGGISILGTTGYVKPISATAYLDSIKTEISVAKANGYHQIVLTLGNSSFAYAKENFDEVQIVEIGNFVYDAIKVANDVGIASVIFVCGIGKATKVAQGHKNTHNRFGSIDFEVLKKEILYHLDIDINIEITKTVKGITLQLGDKIDAFYQFIKEQNDLKIKTWFSTIDIETRILK